MHKRSILGLLFLLAGSMPIAHAISVTLPENTETITGQYLFSVISLQHTRNSPAELQISSMDKLPEPMGVYENKKFYMLANNAALSKTIEWIDEQPEKLKHNSSDDDFYNEFTFVLRFPNNRQISSSYPNKKTIIDFLNKKGCCVTFINPISYLRW